MDAGFVVVDRWPGGVTTAAGGTRRKIRLSRPWQIELRTSRRGACVFCDENQKVLARYEILGEGWQLIENPSTPHDDHRLLIPDRCWTARELRTLGGQGRLAGVFSIVQKIADQERSEGGLIFGIQIGAGRGQNIPHAHFHLILDRHASRGKQRVLEAFRPRSSVIPIRRLLAKHPPELQVFDTGMTRTVIGGHEAGQCFIIPSDRKQSFRPEFADYMAETMCRLITLFSDKFRSTQGLPPDYHMSMVIDRGNVGFGMYVPKLANNGLVHSYALLGLLPYVLPWPHVLTAKYLRGEIDPERNSDMFVLR